MNSDFLKWHQKAAAQLTAVVGGGGSGQGHSQEDQQALHVGGGERRWSAAGSWEANVLCSLRATI